MALVVKDRVQETSTTTGTGTITLAGAVSGFQSFSVIGNGNTTYYSITDGTNWEVGVGTYTSSGTTLSRDTVLESSNSDNLVNFGAGSKFVFCTYPADKSVYADASNKVSGYAIENSTIGATTATTGKFTSVTTPSVTATTNDLTLSAISTGAVKFNTLGGLQAQVTDQTSADLVWTMKGGSSSLAARATLGTNSGAPNFYATGGTIIFTTNGANNADALRITHTASAVNYVNVAGAATGANPSITVQGSDAARSLNIGSKGTTFVILSNNGNVPHFSAGGTASAVNYLNARGNATGNATQLEATGTDTNISMAFQPKGTGAIDLAAGSRGVNISNGGTVTAITRTVTGSGYTSFPSVAISAPTTAGGVQATASVGTMVNSAATIAGGGTGYTVGNVLTVVGGTPAGSSATLTVATVSSGVITSVTPTNFGQYTALPTNPVSVTGGSGSGATLNLTYGVGSNPSFTISNAGSGYIEQPTITFSGGGGSGAAAYASVGSTPIIKSLFTTMSFNTAGGEQARVVDTATSDSFIQLKGGSATTAGAYISVAGVARSLYVSSGSGGGVRFFTGGEGTTEQLRVSHTASAVNYVQVTGSATSAASSALGGLSFTGSDASPNFAIGTKGTGYIAFYGQAATNVQSFRISNTNASSSGNLLQVQGAAAGSAPSISAISGTSGTDANIDITLTPKGTGNVRFGTYTGTILTPTGFIEIKDSGGTTRRLLVG